VGCPGGFFLYKQAAKSEALNVVQTSLEKLSKTIFEHYLSDVKNIAKTRKKNESNVIQTV